MCAHGAVDVTVVYAIDEIAAERASGNTRHIGSTRKSGTGNADITVVDAVGVNTVLILCNVADKTRNTGSAVCFFIVIILICNVTVVDSAGEIAHFVCRLRSAAGNRLTNESAYIRALGTCVHIGIVNNVFKGEFVAFLCKNRYSGTC